MNLPGEEPTLTWTKVPGGWRVYVSRPEEERAAVEQREESIVCTVLFAISASYQRAADELVD